jgi:tRNA dimethylallyltransferase
MIIPVILGPTCIGKTSLALEIAQEIGADVLSIDSRQVFKNLDIVTGKYKDNLEVKKDNGYWEVLGVKIWGYDIFEPNEELNVLKYCEFAKQVIEKYRDSNRKLIATCGTGFYLDFLTGKIEFNEIDEARKSELRLKTNLELREILKNLNFTGEIDLNNNFRIITKILNLESGNQKERFEINGVGFKLFYLNGARDFLYSNSDKFTETILQNGAIEEFKINFEKYGNCKSLNGLIYKDISEYLEKKLSFEDLLSKIKFSLHAYIRRQQTYFKKMTIEFSSFDRKDIAVKIKEIL